MPEQQEAYHLIYTDSSRCYDMNYRISAPDDLHSYLTSPTRQELNIFEELSSFAPMAHTLSYLIPEQHSLYEIRLRLDGAHLGMVAFHSPERELNEATINLLMKLRAPLALALSHRLRMLGLWPGTVGGGGNAALAQNVRMPHLSSSHSNLVRAIYRNIENIARTSCTVLLTGETGVGKEVFARYIHEISPRSHRPFIHVNCGALADALIDSELFGHKKGAFTGAISDHIGLFEQAHGGTIFLDEISELPLDVQARLLLVLQNKTIRRVGDTRETPLDIRVLAATNRDLEEMAGAGKFRKDLLFRLNSITLRIPPLRQRREDIPLLAEFLLKKASMELGLHQTPKLSDFSMKCLCEYDWPGNIRELGNCITRSLILNPGPVLHVLMPQQSGEVFTPFALEEPKILPAHGAAPAQPAAEQPMDLNAYMARRMEEVLERTRGRIGGPGGAAEILGVNPSTLRSRLRKFDIPYGRGNS